MKAGLPGLIAVQALRQPAVDIERHGAVRQRGNSPLVQRHGVALQALEVVEGKAHGRWPENPLAVVLRKPEIEAADNVGLHLSGVVLAVADGEANL